MGDHTGPFKRLRKAIEGLNQQKPEQPEDASNQPEDMCERSRKKYDATPLTKFRLLIIGNVFERMLGGFGGLLLTIIGELFGTCLESYREN